MKMDENQELNITEVPVKNKKNKGLIIGIVVAVLLLCAVGGYFVYDNMFKDKGNNGNPNNGEKEEGNGNENGNGNGN